MKKSKLTKIIAIVLALTMLSASFGAVTVGASSIYPAISNDGDVLGVLFADIVDTLLRIITDFLSSLFGDGPGFYPEDDAALQEKINANYYEGTGKDFQDTAQPDAKWHLGYSNASLIPEDYDNGTYYIGGYISLENGFTNVVEGIAEIPGIGPDDMKVRCMALSDGTGRGTVLFAVIDSIGVTNADIKDIRALLADYAAENNIVSINVSSTHCHSGIDTEGLWTRNIAKLVSNGIISGTKAEGDLQQGTNPAYMEWMKEKVANALIKAHKDMKPGTLTYTTKDIGQDYFQNKNRPSSGQLVDFDDEGNIITNGETEIAMTNIERFIFTPTEANAKPTMILNLAAHPDVAGLPTASNSGREISGDYIFYCGHYLEKAGYNFIFFQGAIAGIYMARGITGDSIPTKQRVEESQRFGYEIARIALSLNDTEEQIIANTFDVEGHVLNESAAEITENTAPVPIFDEEGNVAEQILTTDSYVLVIDAQGKDITVEGKSIKVSENGEVIHNITFPESENITISVNKETGFYTAMSSETTVRVVVVPTMAEVATLEAYNDINLLIKTSGGTTPIPLSGKIVAPAGTVSGAPDTVQKKARYSVWYENWQKVDSVEVDPFLNLYIKQVEIPITNTLITAIGKLNMANYVVISNDDGSYSTVTEIGYMELGNQFKTVFLPGEICQDLVAPNGKSLIASNSVTAKPFSDYVDSGMTSAASIFGKDVRCFGVMNDAIGYVVPDNDYTMGDPANHYHELISLGQHVASSLIDGLYELKSEIY